MDSSDDLHNQDAVAQVLKLPSSIREEIKSFGSFLDSNLFFE
jgi:hypothetical protein